MRRPSIADLAARLGIDLTVACEPEPVHGPALTASSEAQGFHSRDDCQGTWRLTETEGNVWTACCDACRAEVGLPARRLDPLLRRRQILAQAGLPSHSQPFRRDGHNAAVLREVGAWISEARPGDPGSLVPAPVIFGLPGRGKTRLLVEICRRLAEAELAVAFVAVPSLLADLQRFEARAELERVWHRAVDVPVLALDDFGAERQTDWRVEQFARLVNERYMRQRPIVMTTNYPPRRWGEIADERTLSRLREMTIPLELGGPDRRVWRRA